MKYVSLILFVLVLAAPFALRKSIVKTSAAADAGTAAERLVIITPHNPDIRKEYDRAFSSWHRAHYGTDVRIDYRVPGGSNDVKRQLAATYSGYRTADGKLPADVPAAISIVWGGGDFTFDQELKPLGVLQPLHMNPALTAQFKAAFPQPTLVGVKLYDSTVDNGVPTPQWIGVCLSSFGICYNPDVYRAIPLPEPSAELGWDELTNPKLAGLVALADPAHASSSAVAYQMVIQHRMAQAEAALFAQRPDIGQMPRAQRSANADYQHAIGQGWKRGMSDLLKIAANARYFTDSSTLVPTDVSRGEAASGVAIDFYSRVTAESAGDDRIRYISPIGATAITPDPLAVLAGVRGRDLELSQHFIEFMLSSEGQRLWILKAGVAGGPRDRALRRSPIRGDVYNDRTNWADAVNPYELAKGFNQRGEWMGLFIDSRSIWVAAWIDARDALQDAYHRIIQMPDSAKRQALIDELAELPAFRPEWGDRPLAMTDVQQIKRERESQPPAEIDEWRARLQIQMAQAFRRHFQKVGDKAG